MTIHKATCATLARHLAAINSGRVHCVPVYQLYGAGMQSFTFRNIPWQSGGNGPEIMER